MWYFYNNVVRFLIARCGVCFGIFFENSVPYRCNFGVMVVSRQFKNLIETFAYISVICDNIANLI